jgi:hypothetical protein
MTWLLRMPYKLSTHNRMSLANISALRITEENTTRKAKVGRGGGENNKKKKKGLTIIC